MIIRYAKLEDVEMIARLWEEMVKEMKPEFKPNVKWWADMAKKLIVTEIYNILVAIDWHNHRAYLAGFMDFFIYPEPATGKIHGVAQHFYVRPKHRNANVASRLYRTAIKYGRSQNVEILELFCFIEEQAMWKRKGFEPFRALMRRSYV